MKNQNLFLFLLLFLGNMILYAQCSVNAGGNQAICGTSYTLQGTSSGSTSGTPTWSIVSKPSGAPDPVFSNANSLTPTVTGMTSPGNYVFQIAQNCSPSGSATSQVTITAPGANTGFTAGPDITNVNATIGSVTLNGVVPTGYTASWSAYNIYSWERSSIKTDQNSQFSSTTLATTTFSLINKANHDIDPAYVVTLRITSNNNPSCYYEDTAIVRFIPNPQIVVRTPYSECLSSSGSPSIPFDATSPKFSQGYAAAPGSSGNFGTTITMNVVSQPAGGNIAYQHIRDNNIYLTGINVVGIYKFTLTVANSAGTYTTPELTYTFNGTTPNPINFITASRPEQMMIYQSSNSGGEVQCNFAGQTTPITVLFALNSSDAVTLTSTVANSGITPPGGVPVLSTVSGSGTSSNRSFTVTPPTGGWQVGTYRFTVVTGNGTCSTNQIYYIHISSNNRPNVTAPATTVCYSGSGAVTATIPLPAVYKGVVNTSYFQDFDGRYRLTLVSKPSGAADPVFEPYANTLFTNTNTTISNLNMQGEYVFKIKADTYNPSVGAFLDKEYACSGTSLESNFSVFVSAQVGANAGSPQTLIATTQTTFNANNPGVATGAWTLLTKPATATDPVIATPSSYNTSVTGFNTPGTYTFRWTVTTGATCTSTSDLTVNVINATAGGVSGADFWVRSDDAGTIATAWKDQSANANNIPNVGGMTLSPADRAHNFHPYTTGYTASKYFYNTASVMNSTNGELPNISTSIFSAVRPTTVAGGRITGIDNDATNAAEPGVSITSAGRPRQYEFWQDTTSSDFSTAFNNGISNVYSAIANNTVANGGTSSITGGEKRLGLNGSYESFSGFPSTNKFQLYGQHLRVGHGTWDVNGAFPGDIMEVLWFKRVLTSNEQSRINSYLAVKNGVTLNENYLSTASTVVWDRTLNIGYNNNIFGIARDNITVLHQKQSGSVNTGQKLVISTTGFANSNAANSTDLANDLQYLVTGDNGLKQSLNTPLAYTAGSNGATNYRFESIWKVQNSGTVGTVTVAWPKSVKNLYLVQSPDATFDGTDTFTPMATEVTVDGVVYNTANVTLTNGQFFTFAGFAYAPGGVINNLSYWYRADKDAVNTGTGTDVTSWTDFFSGTVVSQMGTNALPKYKEGATDYFNFNPGVNFTAATQTLGNINVRTFSADSYDLFTFTKEGMSDGGLAHPSIFRSLVDNAFLTGGLRRWDGLGIIMDNRIERFSNTGGNTDYYGTPAGAFSTTIPSIMYHTFTALTTTRALNGNANFATTTHSGTGVRNLNGGHLFGDSVFSSNGSDNRGFIGHLGETIIYGSGNLSATERRRVDSYLAIKYGMTLDRADTDNYLSSDGGVIWNGSTNTGYNNNIFGIANDELSALHQKQSKSVNANQKIIIGAGNSLANTNAANTNSLVAGQFLLTGDNGLKQSLTTPLAYTAGSNGVTNFRFESIWKVQNSGSVGTVTVAWPKGVKNLYLVQSADQTFASGNTFTPMATEVTVNGVIYNTANVTLGNGQFFTFAGFGNAPGGVANSLSYWYRADKDATNTGAATDVTAWKDVWNGTTVAQLGTNALPKYVTGTSSYFNYNPGINFTAVTQTLGNTSVQTVSALEFDIFTLTKENILGNGANNRLFSSLVDNSLPSGAIERWDGIGLMTDQGYPNYIERVNNAYGARYLANPGNISRSTTIPSIMYHRFTDLNISKGLNGAANGANGTHTARGLMNGGHAFGDTRFSGNGSDNGGFTGNIGETIIYGAGNLTATERRRVDSYLAIKYGITLGQLNTAHYLNADANIVWNGGANTTYNNNVFGVAREDIGLFEQKVSTSVNAGTILNVATNNDFVNPNNTASRTSFANDKTYFMLGDNNITATTFTSMTINGFTGASRIARTWLAQRSNTSGTMYFGADLSSYGGGFGSGDQVKMIIADDAAFTTNVVLVNGTYDATTGKWVHSYNFDSGNANRYITYATVNEVACTTGCNDNTYLNSADPNTIEYDNLIASDNAIVAKEKDGTFKIWGYTTGPTSIPSNVNVLTDLLVPTAITPANGFNYTGTPLKVAVAGITNPGALLLTTDGLYGWGTRNIPYTKTTNNTNPQFGKITIDSKTDGLPPGVSPANVKMLFSTYQSLVTVTCSGAAWTMNGYASGGNYLYGDGMTVNATNNQLWHRVMKSATETLDNVVAVRGSAGAKFALTSDGKLYTWGQATYIGDGSDAALNGTDRAFATQVVIPSGITPKMIGMTEGQNVGWHTYFLLATNGKLFAMGHNGNRLLGDGTTTNSNVWKEVIATSGSNSLGGNIAWISPSEHGRDTAPSINVLTIDKKQWGWGDNVDLKLGQPSGTTDYNPIYMPGNSTNANGMDLNNEIIAVESGGRFTMNYKNGTSYFGLVGASTFGTIGNGSTGNASFSSYTYNTGILDLCIATSGVCYKPGISGTGLDTKAGITALSRAGATDADNWPMTRKGGWLALEAKTKGFVPNRVAFSAGNPVGIAPANFVEGMMVYDTTNKCLKMYTLKEGDVSMAWHCISTQTCPD